MQSNRRAHVELQTPTEKTIRAAIAAVEALPADIRLSQASTLLLEALWKVADYEDAQIKKREQAAQVVSAPPPPADRTNVTLTDGSPVTPDHKELKANGQQKAYVVLSEEERVKGFIRPVRRSYKHVGAPAPKGLTRALTAAEQQQYAHAGYVLFEEYPEGYKPHTTGRFWTQEQLDNAGKGCGTVTTMSQSIAETYARDPHFYGGTYCCGCGTHRPVGAYGEFVWVDAPNERVGT